MIPGPDNICRCIHCNGKLKHTTLFSSNTFGARIWSDGKAIFPMMPEPPPLIRCPHCQDFFWLNDAENVDIFDQRGANEVKTEDIPYIQDPTFNDLVASLDSIVNSNESEELYIRVLILWAYNNKFRGDNDGHVESDDSKVHQKNIEMLISMIRDDDETHNMIKAELYRYNRDFDGCRKILDTISQEDYKKIKDLMLEACENGNTSVFQIT